MQNSMSKLTKWLGGLVGVAALGGGGYWGYQQWQASNDPAAAVAKDGTKAADAKGDGKGDAKGDSKGAGKGGKDGKGGKGGKGGRGTPAPVAIGMARSGNVNVYLSGLGTVTPMRIVTVRSRVEGELVRVHFKEGQSVKQGMLLAEVDPRAFQAQLLQAQGQMQRDQALLANARVDLERYRTLLKQDSIAEQQVSSQEALVRQLEGTVKIDQGQVDNARLQLSYARITAPISGELGLRLVDQGNIVRPGDATGLVVITQLKPVTVLFTIPQDDLQKVLVRRRSGERIPVEIYDRELKTRLDRGVLLTVDNQIDTATGTVRLKAQVRNEEGLLFPNQFVNVRMLVDVREDAVTVPSAAIQRGAQGIFVYVVNEDLTVTMRPVKTSVVDGNRVVVDSGVKGGERVVVDGMDRLRDGMKVELANRERAGKGEGKGKGKGKGRRGGEGEGTPKAEDGKDGQDGKGGAAADAKSGEKGERGTKADGETRGKGERRKQGERADAADADSGNAPKKDRPRGDRPKREREKGAEKADRAADDGTGEPGKPDGAAGATPKGAATDAPPGDGEPRRKGGKGEKSEKGEKSDKGEKARWGKREQANE